MDTAHDGSLNRHGGVPSGQYATGESNADEAARERAEAVEDAAIEILGEALERHIFVECPECRCYVMDMRAAKEAHVRECELLRARAESEVDGGGGGR